MNQVFLSDVHGLFRFHAKHNMPKYIDEDTGKDFPLHTTAELTADLRDLLEDVCNHITIGLRRAFYKNGSVHFRKQCLRCGEFVGSAVPKAQAPDNVADADLKLQEAFQDEREKKRRDIIQKHIRLQRKDGNLFKKRHLEYLGTQAWKDKRNKVLCRSNWICEGCLDAKATQVHHLTYDRWSDELLFDLVALCAACHAKCHPQDQDWPIDLPCNGCRWQAMNNDGPMTCSKFACDALDALSTTGPCGPDARELEPLK